MWMRMAALAVVAFVPCVYAQGTDTPDPLTLDAAIARGIADVEAGRVFDTDEVFVELEREISALPDHPAR